MSANGRAVRAALYTRVSTKEQVEGTSLDTQLERLRAHANAQSWEIVGEFTDEGVSGELPAGERPGAGGLIGSCERGEVDVVVVTDLDRFGRDVVETLHAERKLERAGVGFVTVGEGIDTRQGGRLNMQLRAVIAEEERRKIKERTGRGLRARARAGHWPGGPAPFGLQLEATPDGSGQRAAIREDEAAILREATRLIVDEGYTTWTAARVLNARGLLPRNAPRWVHNRLRKVLQSPYLSGEWHYKPRRQEWDGEDPEPILVQLPEILTPERHAALLDALGATSTGPQNKRVFFLLSRGRLLGLCGAPMHGVSRQQPKTRHYRCQNSRPEAVPRCHDHRLNADQVEEAVWAEVVALLSEPERLLRMADDYLGLQTGQVDSDADRIEQVDRKLAELEQVRTRRLTDALKAGVDPGVLKAADLELESEERAWRAHRARLQQQLEQARAGIDRTERLRDLAASARERLGSMGPRERRAVLNLLDVEVTVTGWSMCSACEGRGKTEGGIGGLKCEVCHAMRRVPSLRVEGVVLDRAVRHLDGAESRRSTCCRP